MVSNNMILQKRRTLAPSYSSNNILTLKGALPKIGSCSDLNGGTSFPNSQRDLLRIGFLCEREYFGLFQRHNGQYASSEVLTGSKETIVRRVGRPELLSGSIISGATIHT
jgi:hypothetical protein